MTKYLVHVWGDVEPKLHGPYATEATRLNKARRLLREDYGTCFCLDVDAQGKPHVGPYSAAELPHPAMETSGISATR
jgi:hypothetical protein